jgi:hypothetical protein
MPNMKRQVLRAIAMLGLLSSVAMFQIGPAFGEDNVTAGTQEAPVAASEVTAGAEEPTVSVVASPPDSSVAAVTPRAYLSGASALPSTEIEAWLSDPKVSFASISGADIVSYITKLTGSDGRTVSTLIHTAETDASPLHINQIARGMAKARNAASEVAVTYAEFVDTSVAGSTSARFIAAYQAALGEETAAINAPGGVAGGADGGSLSGGTNMAGSGNAGTGGFENGPFNVLLSASYSGGEVTASIANDGSPTQ